MNFKDSMFRFSADSLEIGLIN